CFFLYILILALCYSYCMNSSTCSSFYTSQYMAWENIFAPQTMNSNNKPSEYAVQAEFVSILKELLTAAHASLLYRVLAEAKEHDEDGQRHRRLNILLHDHNLPPFGFELVISATQDKFDEH